MKSVLIVDDSSVVRKFVKNIFLELGFEVAEAGDGQAALKQFKVKIPDIIMLDWNMPVMTGIEFLENLRKEPSGDKPTVIFCTTENEMDKIQKAIGSGANEYIMKPFDTEIVKMKLQQLGVL